MRKKLIVWLLLLALSVIIFIVFLKGNQLPRDIQWSPMKDKYLTLLYLGNSEYYIIPYKYNASVLPKDNFVKICLPRVDYPYDHNYITVNWYPQDKFLKFHYAPCDGNVKAYVIENRLIDSCELCFSEKELFDSGEVSVYPKFATFDLFSLGKHEYSDNYLDSLRIYLDKIK